ncbi:MAG TPA: SfnB family sulfur acquisition oxidoreductase [Chthoniobacterales bacterium]|nr:SfnB family sulfur acquisition oxidoreductase [Chthoniobacterales bacterium]
MSVATENTVRGSNARAHRIASDREAIQIAQELRTNFAVDAARRDEKRIFPVSEIEAFSCSGLWAITVPRTYGGAEVSASTLAEVVALISEADASIGQIPQNHYFMIEVVRWNGTEDQKRFFFERVLNGDRFGNALSERNTKTVADYNTRITPSGEGFILNGQKFYSTGALFADWIVVVAKDPSDYLRVAFVPKDSPGLEVIDDWSSFGQRTTGSGTALFQEVYVPAEFVMSYQKSFDQPSPLGPLAQIIHAAVDLGIARAAIKETVSWIRTRARPWVDSGRDSAAEDPLSVFQIGELYVALHAAEELLRLSGQAVDNVLADANFDTLATASVAVAEAKVLTTEISLAATNKLFELSGTASTLAQWNLDRHWRNARTHTLHDPVRWKYFAIGNFVLNQVRPPRNGAI